MEFLFEYGIFFAKTITLIVGILVVVIVIVGLGHKTRSSERGGLQGACRDERFGCVAKVPRCVLGCG